MPTAKTKAIVNLVIGTKENSAKRGTEVVWILRSAVKRKYIIIKSY
jgi:hypothetical protein